MKRAMISILMIFASGTMAQSAASSDSLQALLYSDSAAVYTKMGRYDLSEKASLVAADHYLKINDTEHYIISTNNAGRSLAFSGDYPGALAALHPLRHFSQSALGTNSLITGSVLNTIGIVHYFRSDYDSAFSYYTQNLEIQKKLLSPEHPDLGRSYGNLALVQKQRGHYVEALDMFENVLKIHQKQYGDRHPIIAATCNNMGSIYYDLGNYRASRDFHRRAYDIRLENFGDKHPDLAQSCHNLGNTLTQLDDYAKAQDYLYMGLSIRLAALGEDHFEVANSYHALGILQFKQDNFTEAMPFFEKAKDIYLKSFPEDHPLFSMLYENMAEASAKMNNPERAISDYQKSADLLEKKFDKNHPDLARPYLGIAKVLISQGKFSEAQLMLQKAQMILEFNFEKGHPDLGLCYYFSADLAQKQGNIEDALNWNSKALRAFLKKVTSIETIDEDLNHYHLSGNFLDVFFQRGKLLESFSDAELNHWDESYSYYRLCVEGLLQLQKESESEESKQDFRSSFSKYFDAALKNTFHLWTMTQRSQYAQEFWDLLEKSKAARLRDMLHQSKAMQFAGIPDSVVHEETNLRIMMSYYEQKLATFQGSDTELLDKKVQAGQLRESYRRIIQDLETQYPDYYGLKYGQSAPIQSDIQAVLKQKNTVLMNYYHADSTVYLAVMHGQGLNIFRRPADNLSEIIENFRQSILTDDKITMYQISQDLYQILILPAEDIIENQQLVIIPDGFLHRLPFETLMKTAKTHSKSSKQPWLIVHHPVVYALSASMLFEEATNPVAKENFIGFAPVFSERAQSRWRAFTGTLPYSKQELENIAALFTKDKQEAQIISYQAATEARFKESDFSKYGYVHLGTHTKINYEQPELSCLVFEQYADSIEDALLFPSEIYTLTLPIKLLTLSACESSQGKLLPGEGMLSLSRSFFYAGVQQIIASFWQVEDRESAVLMPIFYKAAIKGDSPAIALQKMKYSAIKSEEKPFTWAAFQIYIRSLQ
jgi:CHAT domain-containing protein